MNRGPSTRSARGLEVLGHKECVGLLRDRRLHSDHMGLVEAMGFPEGPAKEFKKNMLLSHGRDAYRTRIRQALIRAIGASVIEEQRPMIRQLARELLQKIDPDKEPICCAISLFGPGQPVLSMVWRAAE